MLGSGEKTVKRKISTLTELAFFPLGFKTVVGLGLSLERDAFASQGMLITENYIIAKVYANKYRVSVWDDVKVLEIV